MNELPKIYGFNKTSEAGPDILAYSIFLGGCNFVCPYCMNSKLLTSTYNMPVIDFDKIKKSIVDGEIKWVIISGGEALVCDSKLLTSLIIEIKALGCNIGLSTNGSLPLNLLFVISMLNYVAIDIKGNRNTYKKIFPHNDDTDIFDAVLFSKSILEFNKNNRKDFNYELRTTLFPPFVDGGQFDDIGKNIKNGEKWVLQQYRPAKNMLDSKCNDIKSPTDDELLEYLNRGKKYTSDVSIRYV